MKFCIGFLSMVSILLSGCRTITPGFLMSTPLARPGGETAASATAAPHDNQTGTAPPPTPLSESPVARLTLQALRNSEFHSPDWGDFQLVDGIAYRTPLVSGESPQIYSTRLGEPIAYGDLDGDGLEDATVILSTQNGGTGHFMELAAVINRNGQADNVSTAGLGDRVAIQAAQIEAGVITLDMRVHGANDGLCCPSQPATWRFRLENGRLVRVP